MHQGSFLLSTLHRTNPPPSYLTQILRHPFTTPVASPLPLHNLGDASSSLPAEVLSRILNILSETSDRTIASPPPYATLLSCALVSKRFNLVATERMYRDLHVLVTRNRANEVDVNCHELEATLPTSKRARDSVRTLQIFSEEDHDLNDSTILLGRVTRALGLKLSCCSGLDLLDLWHFTVEIASPLIKLTGAWRPILRRIKLTLESSQHSWRRPNLRTAFRSLPALRGIDVSHEVEDHSAMDQPPWNLSFLSLHAGAYPCLSTYAKPSWPSLRHLILHLPRKFWELGDPQLSSFSNLFTLEVDLPFGDDREPEDLLHLCPFLEPCTQLRHLKIYAEDGADLPPPDQLTKALARLPNSLRLLDLSEISDDVPFQSCFALLESGWAPQCSVKVWDIRWTVDERKRWAEKVDERWQASSAEAVVGIKREGSA
ncbi:hypothetical protein BCR35DRAFT_329138 [Leucosporidium creatinivorum]|uniref:F-box domain-containing protein n=1 Tax=Leucosporidium creatinivorum TaxID=106004 RepID=A0A1Y2G2F7_9BASI|nr:hypothetical protein BCR35DRAFT_329138 [Leucosporidium creatinivorum]